MRGIFNIRTSNKHSSEAGDLSERARMFEESPLTEDLREIGLRLSESRQWGQYFEGDGERKIDVLGVSDITERCKIPGYTMRAEDAVAYTALLLENERRHVVSELRRAGSLVEDTRSIAVGGYQDMIFGIIRAGFPQNPVLDWVSVQPMTRKHGQIYFVNYVTGQTKGQYAQGQQFFNSLGGYVGGHHYSDEYIDREQIGTGDTSTLTFSGTLAYGGNNSGGIRPGTVLIRCLDNDTESLVEIRDNGNGTLVQTAGSDTTDLASGTINYATGAWALTFDTGDAPATAPILASYEADLEGSSFLPQIDIQLTTTPIVAQRRALRLRLTTEGLQDFEAEFGRNLDDEMGAAVASAIITEQAREILNDLWTASGAPFRTFNRYHTNSSNYSRSEHYGDIMPPLNETVNQMLIETQRVTANVMIVDTALATILQSLRAPYFLQWEGAARDQTTLGIKFLGTFNNTLRVYCDPLMHTFSGASPDGNGLLLYKGTEYQDVAYVWGPYRMAYMTRGVVLDDFVQRKAFASRAGRKLVNPRLIKRFRVTNVA